MKRLLSVLLALMMVVSTVSFAVPSVVTNTDYATDAAAPVAEETTDEVAELAEVHADYGQLVYAVDFEQDGFTLDKFTTAYAKLIAKDNDIASYMDSSFDFSNVTTYTNAAGDGFSSASLVTEGDNTYIQGDVAAGYDGFFRMTKYDVDWPAGTYTFMVDVKVPAGQVSNWTVQCNDTKIAMTTDSAFDKNITDWQTVAFHTTSPVSGGAYNANTNPGAFYGFFMTPNNAAAGTIAYDNWKVYYKADLATVVVDANGRSGYSNLTVDSLTPNVTIPVSAVLTDIQAQFHEVIGCALSADGDMVDSVSIEYYNRIYAVYGFDVAITNNGNSSISNVTVEDIDTRRGITVAELVSKINNTSSVKLRGISITPDGEPLADSYVIYEDEKTLYMIWEEDESEYGTLLFGIDFEKYDEGYQINADTNNNKTAETYAYESIANGEFTINWQLNSGAAVTVEADGNKYLRGNKGWAQFRIKNSKYNAASAPMAKGVYTVVADAIDFGTTGRTMTAISQLPAGNFSANIIDSWSKKTNTWDKVVATWQDMDYSDMTWYFTDGATTDVGFDNVKLYFQPVADTVFYVTVDVNGKSGASNGVVSVNAGNAVTVAELKAAMPGCIGIAETANGDMLPDSASILPKYNKTVYAVWGFDVTLNAGQNTNFSNVVVSGIDTRFGTTVGELIAEVNNTTDRTLLGLSTSINGDLLSTDTKVTSAATYYMIWSLDVADFGTLILDIDFEKDGITVPTANVEVTEIASTYNADLVKKGIKFAFGSNGTSILSNASFETEGTNTYLEADTNTSGGCYNFVQISEWSEDVNWLNGTYTYVVDVKTEKALTNVAMHINGLGEAQGMDMTVLDTFSRTTTNAWDTIAFQYNGEFSNANGIGNLYIAPNVGAESGRLAVDNIRLYFKTDETVITLKPNGNTDLSDIEVPVSTSTGITVAELIEEVNKFDTNRVLLGISETPTGDVLAEELRITPVYQKTLYMHWKSKSDNPMLDDNLGKLVFAVDFERQEVIDADWNGNAELDNTTSFNSGEQVWKVASLYDTELLDNKNFRVRFLTNDRSKDYFNAGIEASVDGENHFLQGTTGPEGAGTKWPQAILANNASINLGNGIYTVFIDAMGTGAGRFAPHTSMDGYSQKKIDPVTYEEISTWSYTANSWASYAYSYEITDGSNVPMSGVYFALDEYNKTVAFDNYKLYYKPFTATITLDPGELGDYFGEHTVENISTTGENTGNDIVAGIQSCLDHAGVEFVGLMDEYGDMLNLDAELVIPGDVTYTIIWGEADANAPVTQEKNAIRYSTKVNSRGIRFGANIDKTVVDIYSESVKEYGWIITRPELLKEKDVCPYSFTKDTVLSKPVIVGKNYGYQNTGDEDADRKHLEENDETLVITAVVYGLKPANYKSELLVRPYVVIDGTTYYGKPWSRSMYDTAVAIKAGSDYESYDDTMKAYVQSIIDGVAYTG